MQEVISEFTLDGEACDTISGLIGAFCDDAGQRGLLRYRITAEECMLRWLDEGFAGNKIVLKTGKRFLAPYFIIAAEGTRCNPYEMGKGDEESLADGLLLRMGIAPVYSYKDGFNCLYFRLGHREVGQFETLGLLIVAAIIVGTSGMLLPTGVRDGILGRVIELLYNMFFRALGCVAGPMVFMSVTLGICGIGDTSTFGGLGKKLINRFVGMVFVFAACGVLTFPLFGIELTKNAAGGSQQSSLFEMVEEMLPPSLFEPFITGNTLQIVFLSIITGIALLYLGQATESIGKALEQMSLVIQLVMDFINQLIPYVVFMAVVRLLWSGSISTLLSLWRLMAILAVTVFILTTAVVIITGARRRVSPLTLMRKCIPSFLITLTTASSAAALDTNVRICKNDLGIEESLVQFGIPLSNVMEQVATASYYAMIMLFCAAEYGVACSLTWLLRAAFTAALLALSTPPVPGGCTIAYTLMFKQMGIPMEALAVVLAIDPIVDFFVTSFDVLNGQLTLVDVAAESGRIDVDKLTRRP